jgi:hypothetical protein
MESVIDTQTFNFINSSANNIASPSTYPTENFYFDTPQVIAQTFKVSALPHY